LRLVVSVCLLPVCYPPATPCFSTATACYLSAVRERYGKFALLRMGDRVGGCHKACGEATKRVAVGSGAVRGVVRARDLGLEEGAHGPLGVRPGRAVS
jgi:hypothetical protein